MTTAGRQYPENEAPPLPLEAFDFERPLRAWGFGEPLFDRNKTRPADGPQSQHVHNVFGVCLRQPIGALEPNHCNSITSHAVNLQQLVKKLSFIVVAVAADWSWQNQALERLGEIIVVADALGRCRCVATCT